MYKYPIIVFEGVEGSGKSLHIKNLEKYVLKQERENYQEVQHRIDKIKQKYQALRLLIWQKP